MEKFHANRFPGESEEYRKARDQLLESEIKLRRQLEEVAARRGKLPRGGKIKTDYVFEEGGSELGDQTW